MPSTPKSVPAHRVRDHVQFHYLGDHPARYNVNSLRNLRDEVSEVLALFDRLNLERRKPNIETDARGFSYISYLQENQIPQKPAIKIVQPKISKPIVSLVGAVPKLGRISPPARQNASAGPKHKPVRRSKPAKRAVVKA